MNSLTISPLHMSTMTLGATMCHAFKLESMKSKDWLNKFNDLLTQAGYQIQEIRISGYDDEKECRFKNCIFVKMKFDDKSKRSVMVFQKGYIQVAGCKSRADGFTIISSVQTAYSMVQSLENQNMVTESELEFRLINSNFKINRTLDCERTISTLQGKVDSVFFDQERHSAIHVSVKLDTGGIVKVFIFLKGNFIITGSHSMMDVTSAYEWMSAYINNFHEYISSGIKVEEEKVKKKPGRKRKIETENFYSNTLLLD